MNKVFSIFNFALFCLGFIWAVLAAALRLDYIGGYLAIAFGFVVGILQLFCNKDGKQVNNVLFATMALLAFTATYFPVAALYMGDTVMTLIINLGGLFGPIAVITAVRGMWRVAIKR